MGYRRISTATSVRDTNANANPTIGLLTLRGKHAGGVSLIEEATVAFPNTKGIGLTYVDASFYLPYA